MQKTEELEMTVSKIGDDIIIRPTKKSFESIQRVYNTCLLKGNNLISVTIDLDIDGPKSQRQLRMYKACLPKVVEMISDFEKGYTVPELEKEVRLAFCSHMLSVEGVDLYNYGYERGIDGKLIPFREPVTFGRKVGHKVFNKYIKFFQEYIKSHYHFDPYNDL